MDSQAVGFEPGSLDLQQVSATLHTQGKLLTRSRLYGAAVLAVVRELRILATRRHNDKPVKTATCLTAHPVSCHEAIGRFCRSPDKRVQNVNVFGHVDKFPIPNISLVKCYQNE